MALDRKTLLATLDRTLWGTPFDGDNTTSFVNRSTVKQLTALVAALDITERSTSDETPSLQWEAKVIHTLLSTTLNRRSTIAFTHSLLAARSALCGNRNDGNNELIRWALPLYRGFLVNQHGKPLPNEELLTPEQITAAMRYVFGVFGSGGSKDSPTNELFLGSGPHMYNILRYANADLLHLIKANPDRVDAIIDMVISENTDDPSRLQALLDSNSHNALISGAL